METRRVLLTMVLSGWWIAANAMDLTQSTITEAINDVRMQAPGAANATPAKVNVLIKAPELLRTGAASRAELTAPDQTLTRIGANTVFSFENAGRTIDLQQGSVLFHAPKGKGGGVIKSGGAAAAVLGTTIIVSYSAQAGFKVVVLEGNAKVSLADGTAKIIHAGQMIIVLPGAQAFGSETSIDLAKLVAGSQLVQGFSHPLPSADLIQAAIAAQAAAPSATAAGNAPPPLDENSFQSGPPSLLPGGGQRGK